MPTITSSTLFNLSMPKYTKLNIMPYYIIPKNSTTSFSDAVFNIILKFRNLLINNLYIPITNELLKPKFTN
jgi:hypothetical protein